LEHNLAGGEKFALTCGPRKTPADVSAGVGYAQDDVFRTVERYRCRAVNDVSVAQRPLVFVTFGASHKRYRFAETKRIRTYKFDFR
jgi:hypothetical protein